MKVVSLLISVIQNYKEKRKEKKEERNWKESLEKKIIIDILKHFSIINYIKIKKITPLHIHYIYSCEYSTSLSFVKGKAYDVSLLSKETQHEIKNYFRYKKLKNII